MIEKLIIVALVALACIGGWRFFGRSVSQTAQVQGDCVASLEQCNGSAQGQGPQGEPGNQTGATTQAQRAAAAAPVDPAPGGNPNGNSGQSSDDGGGKAWWEHGLDFVKGVVVDGAWGTVKGIWDTGVAVVTDPAGTWDALKYAVTNPGETWEAIKNSYAQRWETEPGAVAGEAVFEVATIFIGFLKAAKMAKAAKAAKTAKELAEAAGAGIVRKTDDVGAMVAAAKKAGTALPKLENDAIRAWYKGVSESVDELNKQWVKDGLSAEQRARKAFDIRHQARMDARDMMKNPQEVADLQARDLAKYGNKDGPTFDQLVDEARKKGLSGDDAYESIVNSAGRTDKGYNDKFGLGGTRDK